MKCWKCWNGKIEGKGNLREVQEVKALEAMMIWLIRFSVCRNRSISGYLKLVKRLKIEVGT